MNSSERYYGDNISKVYQELVDDALIICQSSPLPLSSIIPLLKAMDYLSERYGKKEDIAKAIINMASAGINLNSMVTLVKKAAQEKKTIEQALVKTVMESVKKENLFGRTSAPQPKALTPKEIATKKFEKGMIAGALKRKELQMRVTVDRLNPDDTYVGKDGVDIPSPVSQCPFSFGSDECGYVGNANYCDRTYKTCMGLNNQERFGGFPKTEEKANALKQLLIAANKSSIAFKGLGRAFTKTMIMSTPTGEGGLNQELFNEFADPTKTMQGLKGVKSNIMGTGVDNIWIDELAEDEAELKRPSELSELDWNNLSVDGKRSIIKALGYNKKSNGDGKRAIDL